MLKSMLFMLPDFALPVAEPYGLVMLVSTAANSQGKVLRSFRDPEGRLVSEAASVEEWRNHLYPGGDYTPAVLKFELPDELKIPRP